MENLSNDLKVEMVIPAVQNDCYYTYNVYQYLNPAQKPIFNGRIFVKQGQTLITLYLNDIIESCKLTDNMLSSVDDNIDIHVNKRPISININVRLFDASGANIRTETKYYLLNSNYPFKDYLNAFKTQRELNDDYTYTLIPYLQGINAVSYDSADTTLECYPHYPAIRTNNLNYIQLFQNGSNVDSLRLGIVDKEGAPTQNFIYNINIPAQSNDTAISVKLNSLVDIMNDDADGIYVSQSKWSDTIITGYKLFTVRINDFDMRDQEAYWFMHDWAYTDGYFKAYDQTYGEKYAVTDPDTGKDYIEFLSKVPADKLSEYYADLANLRTYGIDVNIQDVTSTVKFYHTTAYFRGTETLYDMNILLNQVYGMDADFLRTKNPAFYLMIDNEDSGMIAFDTPYAIYDPILLSRVWSKNEAALINGAFDEDSQGFFESGKTATATYKETQTEWYPMKVAIVDNCPAKYYLQWYDRFGGIQCQPFDGKSIASVEYDRQELKDLMNHRRINNVGSQAKWQLNTKWIVEDLYPFYESIFVSPYLKLYDTKEDKSYDVIITDKDYTEKTWSNQKKLISLTINLEENTKRHILY